MSSNVNIINCLMHGSLKDTHMKYSDTKKVPCEKSVSSKIYTI